MGGQAHAKRPKPEPTSGKLRYDEPAVGRVMPDKDDKSPDGKSPGTEKKSPGTDNKSPGNDSKSPGTDSKSPDNVIPFGRLVSRAIADELHKYYRALAAREKEEA